MERVVDFLSYWLFAFFDVLRGWVGAVISLFDWPAQALGIPSELFAAALLCVILLALWRAMGGYFT